MLIPISWGIIIGLIGAILGYFLSLIPIIVLTILTIVCAVWCLMQESQAEGGIVILILLLCIAVLAVPMLITAMIVGTIPVWQIVNNLLSGAPSFDWSWLFRK